MPNHGYRNKNAGPCHPLIYYASPHVHFLGQVHTHIHCLPEFKNCTILTQTEMSSIFYLIQGNWQLNIRWNIFGLITKPGIHLGLQKGANPWITSISIFTLSNVYLLQTSCCNKNFPTFLLYLYGLSELYTTIKRKIVENKLFTWKELRVEALWVSEKGYHKIWITQGTVKFGEWQEVVDFRDILSSRL